MASKRRRSMAKAPMEVVEPVVAEVEDDDDVPLDKVFAKEGSSVTPAMLAEEKQLHKETEKEEQKRLRNLAAQEYNETMEKQKFTRLKYLLDKTQLYSTFLSQKMDTVKEAASKEAMVAVGEKRKRDEESSSPSKRKKKNDGAAAEPATRQPPALFTGGSLRDYQFQGVDWMISLWENGLNGILADEMGLGKTVQTIAFFAHLKMHGVWGPFLIVGPLSTLSNWIGELSRFTPGMPCLLYHGPKEERAHLRAKYMRNLNDKFPVIVTSYEIAMRDSKFLRKYNWKYIVVDEGHRLKNMNCKLLMELKSYRSANRLLLSGTPLQNSLTELWSLLNFLLPDIFDDVDSFQSWFDFSAITEKEGTEKLIRAEQENEVVTKLHQILRPFLLRRLKSDVENSLPKKKEIFVYTPLTEDQNSFYKAALSHELREMLLTRAAEKNFNPGTLVDPNTSEPIKLQNLLMQLRKACDHPYLFEYPADAMGGFLVDEDIVQKSGKLQLLDRMFPLLQRNGHRLLIFSQMTKMLDILQDYMHFRGYKFCRLDGAVKYEEREEQISRFNKDPEVFAFLLSTRAGGLGINLVGADTVIIFDSDWNPQMDLQAQDRCHRIGQTKAVAVYRMVTARSVEGRILKRANEKRKLERLVIHKKNFKGFDKEKKKPTSSLEVRELISLLKEEAPGDEEEYTAFTNAEVDQLCDRDFVMNRPLGKGKGYFVVDVEGESEDIIGTLAGEEE